MSNNSQDNLFEALSNYTYVPPVIEYRVFYNIDTNECVSKSVDGGTGVYITVTKDQYDSMEFCPNYYAKNGNIVKKQAVSTTSLLLKKTSKDTAQYVTIKDSNVFVLDEDHCFSDAVDYWCVRNWDND